MKKNLDMTEGKPISLLWAFTFPTLMGNLLNQVYSITDSIVVGRYLGQTALAAVGSTMPVILLLAALMIGINVGVGIIISRYFGQKNEELMRRAFVNSLYLGLFLSAGMMVMGLTFSGTILRWMGTPEGPLQEATAYLEISFITMICPLMYYLFSSAFRGLGDSQTALYCLIVSVLSNIGLDVLFVAVFRWGVAGSAWATALAQALSAVVAADVRTWPRPAAMESCCGRSRCWPFPLRCSLPSTIWAIWWHRVPSICSARPPWRPTLPPAASERWP